jgi:hypothetical protein
MIVEPLARIQAQGIFMRLPQAQEAFQLVLHLPS